MIEQAEMNNVQLTKVFANTLWPDFASFVASANELSKDDLKNHPETKRLRQAVLEQMEGLPVVKVKVFNLEALTVFSTEASQIGDVKSTNAGYLSARTGTVASELTHRDSFSAFEEVIEDKDRFTEWAKRTFSILNIIVAVITVTFVFSEFRFDWFLLFVISNHIYLNPGRE